MTALKSGELQTVNGVVRGEEMGVTLPHEHLFNDLSSVVDDPFYRFSEQLLEKPVSPDLMWGLRQDPYCSRDNVSEKPVSAVTFEVNKFADLGGRTIVDATGTSAIGRNPSRLKEVAEATGLNVVMSTGPYLEKFEAERITTRSSEEIVQDITRDIQEGVGETGIKAGMIGEIGVSPSFTDGERTSLRAGALAQLENPTVALNIHMPGLQRRGDEVLDIVLNEVGVPAHKVSLAHSDPSGNDPDYQHRILDRGVWLEFDMIGLDITFPKEGVSPSVNETVDAVAGLINAGYVNQILLSHDLFLKQMWTQNGGNGFAFVPTVFVDLLRTKGVTNEQIHTLLVENPAKVLTEA